MSAVRTLALSCALALAARTSFAAEAASGESAAPKEIVVQTSRGERRGYVDARSDQTALWLREESDGIVLTSAVDWDDVISAETARTPVSVTELRQSAGNLATENDVQLLTESRAAIAGNSPLESRSTRPARVRNLAIVDVCLVNLDRDVDDDGFQVTVAAVGVDGLPRAVRGTLTAEFIGERRPRDSGVHTVDTLDRWSIPVKASDFVDGVATYTLPFATAAPEWQFDVMPDALLTANLTAFGEGDFSATAPVIVRQFNPMRDDLQLYRGNRFAPQELSNGKPYSRFGVTQGRWPYWPR